MANLDRLVNVQISLATAGVQQQTFSDLMLLGVHTGTNRVDIITGADQLLEAPFAGLTTTSDLYRAAQVAFSQIPGPRQVYIGRRDAGEAVEVALAACLADNADWYGFSDVAHAEADLLGAAAWAEANERLFLTVISDEDVGSASGTEPASALRDANYYRTAWWYNPDPDQFPEVAAAARMFTIQPGGESWANKRLSGVTATRLTETQFANIKAKGGNTFEPFARTSAITQIGQVAAGEWIDNIRGRDWQCSDIQAEIAQILMNADKVPYTDPGIAMIGQGLRASLDRGVRRGLIAPPTVDAENGNRIIPSYTISLPRRSQISSNDVAARVLRDVRFTARLAAAINAVEIRGTLTYDNIG